MASKITKIVANFSTQIATTINVGSTTGALKSPVLDSDGVQLADGKYVMTANLGESNEEHLLFDLVASSGAMSNITSVSRQGVETTGCVRQHRSGAKVTLTNFANLLYISKILTGEVALDGLNPLIYDVAPTLSNVLQLATKGYVDSALSGLVGTASDSTAGTTRMTKNQSSKPRSRSTWLREQDTPDKTIKVESIKMNFADRKVDYAGGNTPNFIDPGFGGDLAFTLNPSNTETVVITVDGTPVTVTFVTSIGATPGNILIAGTVAQTRANFVNFINNPTVTNANQVAVTGGSLTAIQKLSATDDLTLNAFIRAINPAVSSFSVSETMAGAGNTWTANTTKNRYDLIVLDASNTLQIRKGSEAVSPTAPSPVSGDISLGLVLNRTGQTTVRDYNVSGQAYITDFYDLAVYYSSASFGGDGSDGDLNVTSGTTTIDLSTKTVWNYNNISVSVGATLTFNNGTDGTKYPLLKVKGNFNNAGTITTVGLGLPGGAKGTGEGTSLTDGTDGTNGTQPYLDTTFPGKGNKGIRGGATGGAQGTGGTKNASYFAPYTMNGASGAGGGGGGSMNSGVGTDGGNGGAGSLGLYLEIAGNFTNSGTITANGGAGAKGTNTNGNGFNSWGPGAGGGGGGGGAGSILIYYKGTYSNTGTITVAGGIGGAVSTTGNMGGAGGSPTGNGRGGGGGGGGATSFNNGTDGTAGQTKMFGGDGITGGAGGNGGAGILYMFKKVN